MKRTKTEELAYLQGQILALTDVACGPWNISNDVRELLWSKRMELAALARALTEELFPE